MITWLKAVHIATLVFWCAGLFALALMLTRQDLDMSQSEFNQARRYTHFAYTAIVTPMALLAVVSGTWLILLSDVYEPWLFAKLTMVMVLVGGHAWLGYLVAMAGETGGQYRPPPTGRMLVVLIAPMLAILVLVLAKPDLSASNMPDWLTAPQGLSLPLDVPM